MDAQPPLPPEIWEQTPPAAQELIVAQAAALGQLRAEVAQLKATVEELAQRLRQNLRNSSRAPSADPPQAMRQPRCEPSGRRPGGQPGHEGQTRVLVPVEEVDVLLPLKPMQCQPVSTPCRGTIRSPSAIK
jgi:transposase